jgi:hypothetical protein
MTPPPESFFGLPNPLERNRLLLPFEKGAQVRPILKEVTLRNGRIVKFFIGMPIDTPQFEPNKSKLIVPRTPHVYKIPELTVLRKDREDKEDTIIRDVIVMEAHARRHQDDQWYFADGQRVTEVTEGYAELAKK